LLYNSVNINLAWCKAAFTWNIVDPIVAMLRDKHVAGGDAKQRFDESYREFKEKLVIITRRRAFHRMTFAIAVFHVVHLAVFKEKVPTRELVRDVVELDLAKVFNQALSYEANVTSINHAIATVKQELCNHASRAIRTRAPITDDATLPVAEFLDAVRIAKIEWYCTNCGKVFSTKVVQFTCATVLRTIRSLALGTRGIGGIGGVLLKDVIKQLNQDYILCPRHNPDPRKQKASEYTSLKVLLQPFIDRGLVVVSGAPRSKYIHIP